MSTTHGNYVLCSDNDGDGVANEGGPCGVIDPDADGDGLDNDFEILIGTDQYNSDSDGDGMTDYNEVCYDGDCNNYNPHPAGGDLDALSMDTDSDGISDNYDNCPFVLPIRIIDTYYSSINDSYIAAINNDVIKSHEEELVENLILDMDKTVTLAGGYSCDYSGNTGMTTLKGSVEVLSGTVIIENFVIE